MTPKLSALKNKIGGVKSKVINTTANVLSAYPQYKAFKAGVQATRDVNTLRKARSYDNAPDEANEGDAGRTRFMAQEVRDRLTKRY